ncbi:MAG: TPM domain-containing protein [Pseudomonadota bacterium]
MRRIGILFAALLTLLAAPLSAQTFPELTGRVVDEADIIPADVEAELTTQLEALETQSQRQLVVVTVPDLQGYDEQTFTYQLGREWGIGDAERNDGAILLVAPNERRVRIEVGYGLEGYLTDALSALIIQNEILPRFRDDDYPGGIVAGTGAIVSQLQLPPDEAARVLQDAQQQSEDEEGGFPVGLLIWLGFIFFFFVLPAMGGKRRKYRGKGKGPWGDRDDDDDDDDWGSAAKHIILWEVGSAIARGAMSGGGSSSGGFGGGFSGGGGSFGGGGASGGW